MKTMILFVHDQYYKNITNLVNSFIYSTKKRKKKNSSLNNTDFQISPS